MTWFKIDDGFYDHPKVLGLSDEPDFHACLSLWTMAGCWSARYLTNGKVPVRRIVSLGFTLQHARSLVSVGLWVELDGCYAFHDWEAHQPSRDEVESKREAAASRQRSHRKKRAKTDTSKGDMSRVTNALRGGDTSHVTGALQPEGCHSPPARPDPTLLSECVSSAARAEFSEAHRAWAFDLGLDPETLTGKALDAATERALAAAKRLDLPLSQASGLLCDAARSMQQSTGKPWAFSLRECHIRRAPAGVSAAQIQADQDLLNRSGPIMEASEPDTEVATPDRPGVASPRKRSTASPGPSADLQARMSRTARRGKA